MEPTDPDGLREQLRQDARVVRAARMLNTTDVITPELANQIRQQFRGYLRKHRLTLERAARQIGLSASVISATLNDNYAGKQDRVLRRLNNWMEQHSRRVEVKKPKDFVVTGVAQTIIDAIRTVVESEAMGIIYGPAGIGKSMVSKVCCEEFVGGVYVECARVHRSPARFLRQLGRELGHSKYRTGADVFDAIVAELRDSCRLVVLDESHYLPVETLEVVRDIHKQTGVPIVLMGTVELEKGAFRDASPDRGQWASLLVLRCNLVEEAQLEGTPLFSKEDVRAVFHAAQLRLTKDGEQAAWQLANILGFGGLRLVRTLATIAQRYARVQGRDITAEDFWNALADTRTVKEVEVIRTKVGIAA